MWQGRRRLRRLEEQVTQTRADQADLARRLELFEMIAAAAGAPASESAAGPVPKSLLAAASDSRRKSAIVRLDVDSRKVVAVISGEGGDPLEWWPAIRHFASRLRSASVLHLERVTLPAGLSAVACRDSHDDLAVYVSEALDSGRQRAAVMEAVRAIRRTGWRAGLGPAGVGVALLIALRELLARAAGAIGARPVAWGAAATATVVGASAAGIFLAATPPRRSSAASARPPVSATGLPHQRRSQQRAGTHQRGQVQPVSAAGTSPGTGQAQPHPGRLSPAPGPSTTPGPSASPGPSTTPAPSASPSPSPSPSSSSPPRGGTGVCVILLGSPVCLPPISLQLGS